MIFDQKRKNGGKIKLLDATILVLILINILKISNVECLLKTCSPSFDESFLSGGDQINMRWEYCTKMTFSANGYAEWHSWSTYRN